MDLETLKTAKALEQRKIELENEIKKVERVMDDMSGEPDQIKEVYFRVVNKDGGFKFSIGDFEFVNYTCELYLMTLKKKLIAVKLEKKLIAVKLELMSL